MRIDVAFLPSLLRAPDRSVCIVIDVLRATSTLATLFARGVREVTAVAEIERAFALRDAAVRAGRQPPLICGEVGGLPPPGFDYGNSPEEFSRIDLSGRDAVLFTSNGTKALVALAGAPVALAGSLLNRRAVIETGVAECRRSELDLALVCSGTDLGTSYCLEDAFCAGSLVHASMSKPGAEIELGDGAETALRLYRSFAGDAVTAFHTALHGRLLAKIGLAADLEFCARLDLYSAVPRVTTATGSLERTSLKTAVVLERG